MGEGMKKTAFTFALAALLPAAVFAAGEDHDFAAMIRPVPESARFDHPDFNIWCGTMVRGGDGKCHLFYSRWPRKLGHKAWVTHSEVAHAVGESPLGPFKHRDVALPPRGEAFWDGRCTHNPTVQAFDGRFYIYYTGNTGDWDTKPAFNWIHRNNQRIGVAVADSPDGPWQRFDQPLIDVSADTNAPDALMIANPSVTRRSDGGYLMIYKAVAKQKKAPFGGPVVHLTATSDSPTGPFVKQLKPIFTREGVMFPAEDPFVWRGADRFWAIVKDFNGHFTGRGYSLALFESPDGFDWKPARHVLVTLPELRLADGTVRKLSALERPQLFFEAGRPAVFLCAGAEAKDRDHSFNVRIPLDPGLP